LPIAKIISEVAGAMLHSILFNYVFIFIYVIVIVFIRKQYEKYLEFYRETSGYPAKSLRNMIEEIILAGLVAGFITSLVVVFTGITISLETFNYLFLIMAFLLFVNIRYVCFSYAGGILAAFSLVFKRPDVNITSVLMLVAILHLIEGILILINAGKDNVPIIIKSKDGITGAFITQRFWPIPVVLLTILQEGQGLGFVQNIEAAWWPLFSEGLIKQAMPALGFASLLAIINYSEVAITRPPERVSRSNAAYILAFSFVMLLIAIASEKIFAFKILGVIFAVAAHEMIILHSNRREQQGKPLFEPVERGLRILDVLPYSNAEKIGLKRGDIILQINGKDIQTEDGVREVLKSYPNFVWINAKMWDGREKTYEYRFFPSGINNLGIVSVPREREVTYNINYFQNLSIIRNLVARFKGFNRSAG